MQLFALGVILFFCALIQVTSGFGFALLAMPLVTLLLGIKEAAPLVAAGALLINIANTLRLHRHINWPQLVRLGAAGLLGVPLGLWLAEQVPAHTVRLVLGCILVVYAAYSLFEPRDLRLAAAGWVYPTGLTAGMLGGAYNIPGPPLVVYASLRGWPRDEFRSTLQTFFAVNAALVVTGHLMLGHFDRGVWQLVLLTSPALLAGNLSGVALDRYIDARRFQIIVKLLILATGLALIV
ncbi:MAG: sulfite exporter TauE/SafE family protein [Nitrososphaerales archaeon]